MPLESSIYIIIVSLSHSNLKLFSLKIEPVQREHLVRRPAKLHPGHLIQLRAQHCGPQQLLREHGGQVVRSRDGGHGEQ